LAETLVEEERKFDAVIALEVCSLSLSPFLGDIAAYWDECKRLGVLLSFICPAIVMVRRNDWLVPNRLK
jgi:hypothetical protein